MYATCLDKILVVIKQNESSNVLIAQDKNQEKKYVYIIQYTKKIKTIEIFLKNKYRTYK